MPIGATLLKELQKRYEPSALIEKRIGRSDIVFKTDEHGDPILLFIGKKGAKGEVIGERYVRTLIFDCEGKKLKDHWELKGKAS